MIAGRIVEMVSGEPLMQFLEEHVFHPLDMKEVWNSDLKKLGDTDAQGYSRNALGPLRPSLKEGAGWMFAAGELAMPAYDLAQWDISIMNRSLLAAKSLRRNVHVGEAERRQRSALRPRIVSARSAAATDSSSIPAR